MNGRRYVGLTGNTTQRWYAHRFELDRGIHHNAVLQEDWQAFGRQAFTFAVLERDEDRALTEEDESRWIAWADRIGESYNSLIHLPEVRNRPRENPSNVVEERRITLAQAVEQFQTSIYMLRKAADRGTLPAKRFGAGRRGVWMVYPADVAAYVAAHQPRTPKEGE